MPSSETILCGLAAVRARFAADAGSIKRLFFDAATSRQVGSLCQALAASRRVYRCVPPAELAKIAGTVHHGGIVAIVKDRPLRAPRTEEIRVWAQRREPLLLLDRIGNPHNLGAIARTAAFFGLPRLVIAQHPQQAMRSEAAYRVAEGGLDYLELMAVPSLAEFCRALRPHFRVVGTTVAGTALRPEQVATPDAPPLALVLGNEEQGLSPEVLAACPYHVRIPGSGSVESLNVSVAAAVLIWECWARQGAAARPRPTAKERPAGRPGRRPRP